MSLIEDLNWRHAVKAFDPSKKVSQENIDKIVEAARLAPTSSGLQPFKVIVVTNQKLKDKLAAGALNPDCMRECSHIIIFAAWNRYTAERIDSVYDFTTDERKLPRGRFGSYTDKLKSIYLPEPAEINFEHIARQTYIALGLALAQAAELKVDTCPVEGFNNKVVDDVLELEKYELKSVSLIYAGVSDPQRDWIASMKKVRVAKEDFVIELN
ncbi:MAG: nitroreductase family protein [Lentimicrobium sp.]|jgi:nitroreductase|nr:nitroreductase family protein [Lentimicrobium sp.]